MNFSTENPIDVGVVLPDCSGQVALGHSNGLENCFQVSHTWKYRPESAMSLQKNKVIDSSNFVSGAHNGAMPKYKYRDNFDRRYHELRKKGMTLAQIAKALGRSTHAVNTYRRKDETASIPPQDVCLKMSQLCGPDCSIFEFMDSLQRSKNQRSAKTIAETRDYAETKAYLVVDYIKIYKAGGKPALEQAYRDMLKRAVK